jgi:hypothetical protein
MVFEIRSQDVNVEALMRQIRERIAAKRAGLFSEAELRELAEQRLEPPTEAGDFDSTLLADLSRLEPQWNFTIAADSIYASARTDWAGRLLTRVRRLLKPLLKLMVNPSPLVQAVYRQSQLNTFYVALLHESAVELTRLGLEVQTLKSRMLELSGRLDHLTRREKTLEDMVVYRDDAQARPAAGDSQQP